MPTQDLKNFMTLHLDPENPRIRSHKSEKQLVSALIRANPKHFWGLMKSLLLNGYEPTENLLILKKGNKHVVREGNRRVAALKIIEGKLTPDVDLPSDISQLIADKSTSWKKDNAKVPCLIFSSAESKDLERIVSRIHSKGSEAARLNWDALARARDLKRKGQAQPHLKIFETYLKRGPKLVSHVPKARWEGDFPFTVVVEAMKSIAAILGLKDTAALASAYPSKLSDKNCQFIERVIFDIGSDSELKTYTFRTNDWMVTYGYPAVLDEDQEDKAQNKGKGGSKKSSAKKVGKKEPTGKGKSKATSNDDPKTIKKMMKDLNICGQGRAKLEALRQEAEKMNVANTKHAFCFLLRSMFEISAKAYCADHKVNGLSYKYKEDIKDNKNKVKHRKGSNKSLRAVMKEVVDNLKINVPEESGILSKAFGELNKKDSPLSIDSMNHLIHNDKYSVNLKEICIHFCNVYPLLVAMNDE